MFLQQASVASHLSSFTGSCFLPFNILLLVVLQCASLAQPYWVLKAILVTLAEIPTFTLTMMQWKVEDLVQEINHLEALESKSKSKTLIDKMVASMESKFKCLPTLTPGITLKIMDAIDDSKLCLETKDKLLNCVDSCTGPASNVKLAAAQQGVAHLPMYFTSTDWQKLQEAVMHREVFEIIASRMKLMGLVSMKEEVKAQALAIVLHWMDSKGNPVPEPWPLYYLVKDFSKVFMATRLTCPVASLATYPWRPADLGEEWLAKVYGKELPMNKDLNLGQYLHKIPLRSTSHLLKVAKRPAPVATKPKLPTIAHVCNASQQLRMAHFICWNSSCLATSAILFWKQIVSQQTKDSCMIRSHSHSHGT